MEKTLVESDPEIAQIMVSSISLNQYGVELV